MNICIKFLNKEFPTYKFILIKYEYFFFFFIKIKNINRKEEE